MRERLHREEASRLSDEELARRLAVGVLRDPSAADDAVQDGLVKEIERPPAPGTSRRPWFVVTVVNTARDLRRRALTRTRLADHVPRPEPMEAPEDAAQRAEAVEAVHGALRDLETSHREILELRFFHGLSTTEAASRLGVPAETARTRYKRALAQMRGRLDRRYGGDGVTWRHALVLLAPHGAVPEASRGGAARRSVRVAAVACLVAGSVVAWARLGSDAADESASAGGGSISPAPARGTAAPARGGRRARSRRAEDTAEPAPAAGEQAAVAQRWALYDDFDDAPAWRFGGDWDRPDWASFPGVPGWTVGPFQQPHAGPRAVNVFGGVVGGIGQGYRPEVDGVCTSMHRPIELDASRGFELEVRCVSAAELPNRVEVMLLTDWYGESAYHHYYGLRIYGERANQCIDLTTDAIRPPELARQKVGALVNEWHTYRLTHRADGEWELCVDGEPLRDFRPPADRRYVHHFARIGIEFMREGSQVDWVRVRALGGR